MQQSNTPKQYKVCMYFYATDAGAAQEIGRKIAYSADMQGDALNYYVESEEDEDEDL